MRLRIAAFILLLGIHVPVADAGELSLLLNGKAIHLNPPSGINFNEANWGAGLQYDWDRPGRKWVPFVSVSGFLDSSNRPAYYAGGGYLRRWHFGHWHADAGWIAFVMMLPDTRNGHPFPGILPALSLGTDRVSLNATYIPKIDPKTVNLVFLQLKITLSR